MKMRLGLGVAALALVLSACLGPVIDVTPLHPTPRCLASRTAESVKVFHTRPSTAVAVYGIEASAGDAGELHAAVHNKAASLGCDGILFTDHVRPRTTSSNSATGELNDHREISDEKVLGLCLVFGETQLGKQPAQP
jgi:hypothetical protein